MSPCSITVEFRSWSHYGTSFTSFDIYRDFFHTSNCRLGSAVAQSGRVLDSSPRAVGSSLTDVTALCP